MDTTFQMKRFVQIALCLIVISLISIKSEGAIVSNHDKFAYEDFSDALVEERIANMRGAVDMKYTAESRRKIINYVKRYRKDAEVLLARAGMYFHIFDQALREKNLPTELKYLAIVESALNPKAKSKAGAVGLWQFISSTARMYDMDMNSVVDERRDPNISTHAAFDYLADLEAQFGDWTLALAAYNCGPGNIRKAIRRSGSKDYWKLRKFLPKETQDYIPRFIAASYLMNYYHTHGLNPASLSDDLALTNTTAINDQLNFKELSDLLDMNMNTIETLNPAFLKKRIPENKNRYILRLPEGKMSDFLINKESIIGYFNLPGGQQRLSKFDELKSAMLVSDETEIKVISIAAKRTNEYDASNIFLKLDDSIYYDDNELLKSEKSVPKAMELKPVIGFVSERKKKARKRFEYYKISSGETLDQIVRKRNDLSLPEIYRINNFTEELKPQSGSIIKLREIRK